MRKTTARKTSARMAKKVDDLPPSTGKGDKIKGWYRVDSIEIRLRSRRSAGGEVVSSDAYVKASVVVQRPAAGRCRTATGAGDRGPWGLGAGARRDGRAFG